MNKNRVLISFSQFDEDIILSALLYDVDKGFYVDVGANDPVVDSVTKYFYDQGWNGINIEPLKSIQTTLVKLRPKDINLAYGVGDKNGSALLREYINLSGHSTFDDSQKNIHDNTIKYREYTVPIKTLASILNEYAPDKHIHFFKIDVEGYEYQVLAGNDWKKYKPEVICIEANHVSHDWRPILINNNYQLFIEDGLNEYYVNKDYWFRTDNFAERAVINRATTLRFNQFKAWKQDIKDLNKIINQLQKLIIVKNAEIIKLKTKETLSLKDIPYKKRFKRAIYGLSIDWYNYTKKKSKK